MTSTSKTKTAKAAKSVEKTVRPPADTEMDFTLLQKLNKDLREASKVLKPGEVRYMVDAYYAIQEYRTRAGNQVRASSVDGEPNLLLTWQLDQMESLEKHIKNALNAYTNNHPVGEWMRGINGIGPVTSAGLLAHIDITKAPTVGHIWAFAGLDPTKKWAKGQKRPFNARLKVLCFHVGESFVKQSGRETDIYGKYYLQRKQLEWANNLSGKYADQAKAKLENFNIGKDTEAYYWYSGWVLPEEFEELQELDQNKRLKKMQELAASGRKPGHGMLPPAHIHARAKRYATKLFLAHLHEVMYRKHYDKAPPLPYPIAHLGHAHVIPVPGLN